LCRLPSSADVDEWVLCTRARLGVFCLSPFDGRPLGGGHLEPQAWVSSGGCPGFTYPSGPGTFIRTDHIAQQPSLRRPDGSALRCRSVVHALVLRCDTGVRSVLGRRRGEPQSQCSHRAARAPRARQALKQVQVSSSTCTCAHAHATSCTYGCTSTCAFSRMPKCAMLLHSSRYPLFYLHHNHPPAQ